MTPCHPGAFIREEILHELNLPVARGRDPRGAPGDPVRSGQRQGCPVPEMALRIEKAFGVSMDTLLRMQAWHDSHILRQRAAEIDVKRYEPA
jgi:antitoxin HigA-1